MLANTKQTGVENLLFYFITSANVVIVEVMGS